MTVALVIGAVLLAAIVFMSWYGWTTLPGDARVPIHFGVGYNNFVSKRIGLLMYPGGGLVIYVIMAVVIHSDSVNGTPNKLPPTVGFPLGLGVILLTQMGAIRVARRMSGR
jgi:hypothetical protein